MPKGLLSELLLIVFHLYQFMKSQGADSFC